MHCPPSLARIAPVWGLRDADTEQQHLCRRRRRREHLHDHAGYSSALGPSMGHLRGSTTPPEVLPVLGQSEGAAVQPVGEIRFFWHHRYTGTCGSWRAGRMQREGWRCCGCGEAEHISSPLSILGFQHITLPVCAIFLFFLSHPQVETSEHQESPHFTPQWTT